MFDFCRRWQGFGRGQQGRAGGAAAGGWGRKKIVDENFDRREKIFVNQFLNPARPTFPNRPAAAGQQQLLQATRSIFLDCHSSLGMDRWQSRAAAAASRAAYRAARSLRTETELNSTDDT